MMAKYKQIWLEANMEIYRNGQEMVLTITGKKINNLITHLIAFANSGQEIILTTPEQLRAETILLGGNK